MVGLDAIERYQVDSAPEELRTTWNPVDYRISARRSRRLVLDMSLVKAIDCIDFYIKSIRASPCLIQNAPTENGIDNNSEKILNKINLLVDLCELSNNYLSAMVRVLVRWRNRAAHFSEEVKISEEDMKILVERREEITERFCNLNVDRIIDGIDSKNYVPTFKETLSIINASSRFVHEIDGFLLNKLDVNEYIISIIRKENSRSDQRLLQSIWGRDLSTKKNSVVGFLKQNGFSETREDEESLGFASISEEFVEKISAMSVKEVRGWIGI